MFIWYRCYTDYHAYHVWEDYVLPHTDVNDSCLMLPKPPGDWDCE